LAVRALILQEDRVLLVNAWPEGKSDLWCAPGGGVERGHSLPDNLKREVYEECGLDIAVGAPCLVNEFHDPDSVFHQVDIYFHATIIGGQIDPAWRDPEGVVTARRFVTETELRRLRVKPDSLADLAFGQAGRDARAIYDALEPILR
jgi:ADP-ribose pyrophosphatase YjhB (NUDIX family)